jgi:hypothetical protein
MPDSLHSIVCLDRMTRHLSLAADFGSLALTWRSKSGESQRV